MKTLFKLAAEDPELQSLVENAAFTPEDEDDLDFESMEATGTDLDDDLDESLISIDSDDSPFGQVDFQARQLDYMIRMGILEGVFGIRDLSLIRQNPRGAMRYLERWLLGMMEAKIPRNALVFTSRKDESGREQVRRMLRNLARNGWFQQGPTAMVNAMRRFAKASGADFAEVADFTLDEILYAVLMVPRGHTLKSVEDFGSAYGSGSTLKNKEKGLANQSVTYYVGQNARKFPKSVLNIKRGITKPEDFIPFLGKIFRNKVVTIITSLTRSSLETRPFSTLEEFDDFATGGGYAWESDEDSIMPSTPKTRYMAPALLDPTTPLPGRKDNPIGERFIGWLDSLISTRGTPARSQSALTTTDPDERSLIPITGATKKWQKLFVTSLKTKRGGAASRLVSGLFSDIFEDLEKALDQNASQDEILDAVSRVSRSDGTSLKKWYDLMVPRNKRGSFKYATFKKQWPAFIQSLAFAMALLFFDDSMDMTAEYQYGDLVPDDLKSMVQGMRDSIDIHSELGYRSLRAKQDDKEDRNSEWATALFYG